MAYDPSYSLVSLLLHGDGVNNGTVFTDNSPRPKTATRGGGAITSTADSQFGGSSLAFDGSGDYLSFPAHDDFQFGTGDFTIEFWIKTTATNSPVLVDYYTAAKPGWQLSLNGTGKLLWYTTTTVKTGSVSVNTGSWVFVSVVRSSGNLQFYINGTADGSAVAHSTNLSYATSVLGVGAQVSTRDASVDLNGYIDDLRITKGVARANAVPTEAFPDSDGGHATVSVTAPTARLESCYCGANASLTAPRPLFYAGPETHATLALLAPRPTLGFHTGANPLLTAPSPALSFLTHDSTGEQAAYLTAPSPTLVCRTGAKAILTAPSPTLTSGMTITNFARVDATAPSPTLNSSGTVAETASFNLTAPSPNLIGYGGAVCSVQITGRPQLVASATVGSVASFAVTCPLFELTASASADNIASFDLIAPSPEPGRVAQAWLVAPMAQLTAIGTATITATYEAYAVNLKHADPNASDETTRYTNFPFTHVVRYKNSYYGANSTGLYLLEGTTDAGTAIPFDVKTAMTDFNSPMKKTVASAYFSGRFGPASTITLTAGEGTPVAYSFSTPRWQAAQNHRQVFGKGLKERYFALEVAGTGTLELDGIEMDVAKLSRRI